jgi:outer membrane lipase/esterase
VSYAEAGATVDQVATQVSSHLGELNGSTLVTMLAGQNDIVAAYDSADSDAVAQAKLKAKGQQLGQVLNTIIAKGARVLIMTVPDLGLSPKASANRARMTALVNSFNEGVIGTGGVKNDGHFVGRVKGFEHIQDMVNAPSSYSLINVTGPACASSNDPVTGAVLTTSDAHYLQGCSNYTLQSDATAYNYLWADDTHLTPAAHAGLGNLAYVRARDNPF